MNIGARRSVAQSILAAAALATWMLWRFPPQSASFYPQCPVFFWLHIQCPGCGATRACAALLHGRLREALQYNTMFVALLPAALAFCGVSYWRAMRAEVFDWPRLPNRLLAGLLAVACAFTLARNL